MNMKRMRGRGGHTGHSGHRQGGGQGGYRQSGQQPMNRNHVFDSSGPDMRMRGTAQQLFEKYLQLGRDATSAGDRVMAESYFQYAEHYFRILNAMAQAQQQNQPQQHQPRRWQNGPEAAEQSAESAEGEGEEQPGMNGHSSRNDDPEGNPQDGRSYQ
ncbi:DUF4167 domain-containing protein [Roseomonas sp. OT10]|uniref:DUF4167 domain-containing protein n=1 Tax=Roseomonas cutis TaxID=2897332 RepID=UPI001E3EC1D2|nr:DUF4167 domain-containing protein [Roseomonas sp. OT10]UFN50124.1 DUF4167 domain-containing protein [Roseomonas sp. OT10]